MQKLIFFQLLLTVFFDSSLYAQPKAVCEPFVIAKTSEPFQKPVWSDDGNTLYFSSLETGMMWSVSRNGDHLLQVAFQEVIHRKTEGTLLQQMMNDPVKTTSKVKALESLSGYMIFNPVLSPKGDKIVFQVSRGKGMYVCDSDGANLRPLSEKAQNATWMPDAKYIVAMITEDDGHSVSKGELVCIEVATGTTFPLLSSDKYVAFHPAVSPDGKKLAFEDYAKGVIYVMDLEESK